MHRLNVRLGGEAMMKSDRTDPLVTNPNGARFCIRPHTCPDAKSTGLSDKDWTKVGARLKQCRALLKTGRKFGLRPAVNQFLKYLYISAIK
jgi:hypothetical protein